MKILSMTIISIFLLINVSYAKTLVKYHKTTGEIIQTNVVDDMPSDEILNDRFRSDSTDVILVDDTVDIATQRVDLNKKKIKNIPTSEIDNKKQIETQKENKIKNDKDSAKAKLKALGLTDDELAVLFKGE